MSSGSWPRAPTGHSSEVPVVISLPVNGHFILSVVLKREITAHTDSVF